MTRGVDTATSTPHASLNSHSLDGWLIRATTRWTENSVLASSETTRFDLVVAGRADHHVVLLEVGVLEVGDLAGVTEQPGRALDPVRA